MIDKLFLDNDCNMSHDLEQFVKISGTITLIENGSMRMQSDELPGMLRDIESRARGKVKELTDIL